MSDKNKERQLVIEEWVHRAKDDLESAEVLQKNTDNYEIVVYHAHQAIEKIIKAEYLKVNKPFRFIHDLTILLEQLPDKEVEQELLDGIYYLNSLYPLLRYPSGDTITKEQAKKSINVAKELFGFFNY